MKTRIVSGAVGFLLLAAVFCIYGFFPLILPLSVVLLSTIAVGEMLIGTGYVKNKTVVIGALVYSAIFSLSLSDTIQLPPTAVTVVFALFLLVAALASFKTIHPLQLTFAFAMPLFITFAFASLCLLINIDSDGFMYIILALNYAWCADIGAYFTGTFLGKHKLAPKISPKKTIEGSVGGMIFSTLTAFLIVFIYSTVSDVTVNWLIIAVISPLLAICGMVGDLAASYIKRDCGIKDYGNIMPGHGGVLDRFDSVLLTSTSLYTIFYFFPAVITGIFGE